MYIRRVKTKNKETGTDYFTYRLVKNIRESGMPKQINLISLGKLDDVSEAELPLLSQRIESLYNHEPFLFSGTFPKHIEEKAHFFTRKLIQKKFVEKVDLLSDNQEYATEKQFVEIDINSTLGQEAANIGGEFLCKQAINELGLDTFLKDELHYTDSELTNSMLSIIGRLLYSSNEYQTARWLNDNSAIQEFYPLESGHVTKNQLYSAAKQLYKDKDKIECYLNRTIEQTFDLRRKIVLYDLTNTHFEGMMQESKKAKHGRNKQKRTDCRQVTLGMLTDEHGFPIHTQYYEGNIAENKTFEKILTDLSSYGTNLFAEEKPCIIMDAGIATEDNIKILLRNGYQYICVSRSQHSDLISQVDEKKLVHFKNKSDKELSAQLFKQSFEYEDLTGKKCSIEESLLYVKSPDKEKKEHSMDENKIVRFEKGLESIAATLANPRGQKGVDKIHQRLGRLKERNRGVVGFFEIDLQDDKEKVVALTWSRKPVVVKEKKQGVYFLRTNVSQNNESKLWHLYRLLNEIEDAFGTLKSELKIRPNFHHSDATIEAHINLCVLSYYIVSFIRYRLKKNGIKHDWDEIRRLMSTQKRCTQVSCTREEKALWTKYCTRPTPEVEQIYDIMGYKKIPFYRKNIVVLNNKL